MIRVAIIGYGEVGGIMVRDLAILGCAINVWDTAFSNPDAPQTRKAQATASIVICDSANAAAAGADLVIVCVTAGSTLDAVAALTDLHHAPLVLEVNSVAPASKREAAGIVTQAGGRYVEAAIMTSIPPKGLRSPMLLGGPHADAMAALATRFDMDVTIFSPEIGAASSVKMCRSVMIKGLEALMTECMLSARHYGVEDVVLASLSDTLPGTDWPRLAQYLIGRSVQHGRRRAEEMREVARTVADAGVPAMLSYAVADRHDETFSLGQRIEAASTLDLGLLLDCLREQGGADPVVRP